MITVNSDIDVVDLTPGDDTPAPPRGASRLTARHRVLGALILGLLAVAGLRVHAVHAPVEPVQTGTATPSYPPVPAVVPVPKGSPATRTAGALVRGSNARLLLLGTTLTTYDVSTGQSARPFGADTGSTVIGAAPLTDGDVVIESLGFAGGHAYATEGRRTQDLGYATSVMAGEAMDTAWLTDTPESQGPNRVRLVNLAGSVLSGPFAIPSTWRLAGAVPGGVLVAVGGTRAPYTLHLWTPGSMSPGPVLADDVVANATGGGKVLTVGADGGVVVDGARTSLPGDAVSYAVSATGSTLAALGPMSLTVQADSSPARTFTLPAGSSGSALAFAPSGWLFVSTGTRVLALAPGSPVLQVVPAIFADPPSDLLAAQAFSSVVNPRVGR